jgi:hypothetical protein
MKQSELRLLKVNIDSVSEINRHTGLRNHSINFINLTAHKIGSGVYAVMKKKRLN